MNLPRPALVTQEAARRLPRWALLLLCGVYVLAGYIGREPWKNADIASFGVMLELLGHTDWPHWLQPTLMGERADTTALLPYWLGAWAMQVAPAWVAPEFAARLPFMAMLVGTLVATWYAVYHLARLPGAQPITLAFGGEASPPHYAHALADGGLLALVATLGLAQFSHETTPALAQLFFSTLTLYGLAAASAQPWRAVVVLMFSLPGLALSGAPSFALIEGVLIWLGWLASRRFNKESPTHLSLIVAMALLASLVLTAALSTKLGLLRWEFRWPSGRWSEWRGMLKLLVWFLWPASLFALWALWQWRRQLAQLWRNPHLGLPALFAAVPLLASIFTSAGDRALLLAIPALAILAAFALPTFSRSASALIDWFTVLFFTVCMGAIWVIWVSVQTGFPAKPASNVARLAPGFAPSFGIAAFTIAVLGTLAWVLLARWRTGRHRTALWKSLVLPASGTALCWLLLGTLWLPAFDYARSFAPQIRQVRQVVGDTPCVEVYGLSSAQVAAVRFHGGWQPVPASTTPRCTWLLVDVDAQYTLPEAIHPLHWNAQARIQRPTDDNESLLIFRRSDAEPAQPTQTGSP
ncbi:hypothetical protein [Ottowia sp.]|uniref:hypothetical protein n=1 Tax=Ottowia sp. TaxID=1898956 RepID=UPI003A89FAE0